MIMSNRLRNFVSVLVAIAFGLAANSQCAMLPASTICGDINPGVTVITPSPACFQSTVIIHLSSDIPVDSICLTFGDGHDTILFNPDTSFNLTHNYNFPPPDDCPGGDPYPGIQCIIQANFYKHCPGNGFSFNFKSTSLSFRFKPRAKFPYHNAVLCAGNCVTVPLDTSCTNTYWQTDSTSYTWSWGDTSQPYTVLHTPFSFYQTPPHCYSSPGVYEIVLSAENGCGTEADSLRLTIQQIDTVRIPQFAHLCTGNPVPVHIIGENANFYSTFITPGSPNDTVIGSTTATPQLIFFVPGVYTVYFSSGACFVDTTITVESGAAMTHIPFTDTCFTGNNQLVLSNYYSTPSATQTNHFSVFDSTGLIYQYDSAGVPSAAINLLHAGNYIVKEVSSSTCDSLVLAQDTLTLFPPTSFQLPGDTMLCLQSFYILPTFANVIIYLDRVTVASDTVYVDSLRQYQFVYTPLCGNSRTLTITAKGTPAQGLDSSFCASPGMIALTGSPAGGTFNGLFINNGQLDGNSAGPGHHPYTYTYNDVAAGCIYIDTSTINIYPAVVINYSLTDTVCAGTAAIFVNQDGSQVNAINFGDTAANFSGNPIQHIYNQSGLQHATLHITDTLGCMVTIADSVLVLPLPIADFMLPTAVCDSTSVIPVLTSPVIGTNTYVWNVGNDTTFEPPTILVRDTLYNIVSYTVNVTVTSPQCGAITQSHSIMALAQTNANFGLVYQANCSPMHLQFADNSRGDSLTYSWYLNDVPFSNDSVPAARWLTADSVDSAYRFKLVVCSPSCGCSTFTDSVTVHPVNFAVCFHPDSFSVCQGKTMTFKDCGRSFCNLIYNFGDGQDTITESGQQVSHAYSEPGTYTVWLTMTCNCMTDSASQQVVIKPSPQVSPAISNGDCTGHLADFNGNVISGNPVTWQWNFGDGGYSGLQHATHTYGIAGIYNGWVLATGSNFCESDTAFFTLPVTQSPNSTFVHDTAVCQRTSLQINVDSPALNSTYIWHVVIGNDSQLITTTNGSLNFNTADSGTYHLSLETFNNANPLCATTTGNMQVVVMPAPVARFTVLPFESDINSDFDFYNYSTNALSYWWSFGNGDSSYAVNPVYKYATPGLYNITLVAINDLCRDTATNKILVNPALNLFIPNTIIANGDGYNDKFQIYGNLEAIYTLDVKIFDRTGEKVYSSNDIYFKWDGTFKGKPVGPAVFVYEILVNIVGQENRPPRMYKGSITVLR